MHQKFATEFKRMMTFHFPLNTFLIRKCSFPRWGKGRGVPLPNQQLNECIAVTLTQTQNAQGGSKKRMHVSKQGSRIWGRVIELCRVCWPKISLALTHLFIHTNAQREVFFTSSLTTQISMILRPHDGMSCGGLYTSGGLFVTQKFEVFAYLNCFLTQSLTRLQISNIFCLSFNNIMFLKLTCC